MQSISRKLTNEPQIADRCRLQAVTEVACEFIADYVVPQMIIRSPRVRPGKFVLVNTKRLLQQYLPMNRHRHRPSACLKGARFGLHTAASNSLFDHLVGKAYPTPCPPMLSAMNFRRFIRSPHALPADLATDDIAEQFPTLALEFPELKLLDRSEVSCAGVDCDAGQKPFQVQILDARGM